MLRLLTPLTTVTARAASSSYPCALSHCWVLASALAASGLAGVTSTSWSASESTRVSPDGAGSIMVSG